MKVHSIKPVTTGVYFDATEPRESQPVIGRYIYYPPQDTATAEVSTYTFQGINGKQIAITSGSQLKVSNDSAGYEFVSDMVTGMPFPLDKIPGKLYMVEVYQTHNFSVAGQLWVHNPTPEEEKQKAAEEAQKQKEKEAEEARKQKEKEEYEAERERARYYAKLERYSDLPQGTVKDRGWEYY